MTVRSSEAGFKSGPPGRVFKDGRLYHFTRVSVTVVDHPENLRTWTKTWEKPFWRSNRLAAAEALRDPYIESLFELGRYSNGNAENSFKPVLNPDGSCDARSGHTIPPEDEDTIRRVKDYERVWAWLVQVPPLERRIAMQYNERWYHVLALLLRCPGADELGIANPALCFALANNWVFRCPAIQRPLRAARGLLRKPHRKIVEWLGFPATRSVQRILSRINPRDLSVCHLLELREALRNPRILKMLQHTQRINFGVLGCVTSPKLHPFLSSNLLNEIGNLTDYSDYTMYQKLEIALEASETIHARIPRGLQTIARLNAVHYDMAIKSDNPFMLLDLPPDEILSEPPYPGIDGIIPLRTQGDLMEEAARQDNCVLFHANRVLGKKVYFYRVTHPVNATLSVQRDSHHDGWQFGQMLGPDNATIDPAIKKKVWQALRTGTPIQP
jgi:hypothetical protein